MDARQPFCLLDVREPWEVALAAIPGSLSIPMNEIPDRLEELRAAGEIIVMCHSGGRSRRVAEFLASRGFGGVGNLEGGITAWSRDVDPGVPEY
jgi:rhodanese-related sulfurtransferase